MDRKRQLVRKVALCVFFPVPASSPLSVQPGCSSSCLATEATKGWELVNLGAPLQIFPTPRNNCYKIDPCFLSSTGLSVSTWASANCSGQKILPKSQGNHESYLMNFLSVKDAILVCLLFSTSYIFFHFYSYYGEGLVKYQLLVMAEGRDSCNLNVINNIKY